MSRKDSIVHRVCSVLPDLGKCSKINFCDFSILKQTNHRDGHLQLAPALWANSKRACHARSEGHACRAHSEGRACHAHRSVMDHPTLCTGPDKQVPPKTGRACLSCPGKWDG